MEIPLLSFNDSIAAQTFRMMSPYVPHPERVDEMRTVQSSMNCSNAPQPLNENELYSILWSNGNQNQWSQTNHPDNPDSYKGIKRPKNAYIMYRSDRIKELKCRLPSSEKVPISEWTKIIADEWNDMDKSNPTKLFYYKRWKADTQLFNMLFPDFKSYRTRRNGVRKQVETRINLYLNYFYILSNVLYPKLLACNQPMQPATCRHYCDLPASRQQEAVQTW